MAVDCITLTSPVVKFLHNLFLKWSPPGYNEIASTVHFFKYLYVNLLEHNAIWM